MDNNLFQRIKELIDANQQIGVVISPNPTFDGMAAGLGLYLALKQMNKQVAVVCPTDSTVEFSSLVGIDKVQKSFGGAGVGNDLIVSFPYKDGEIEKVSYNVDNGKLQIVVKAGPQGLSFNQSDVAFEHGGTGTGIMPSLVFFIGIADMEGIGMQKPAGTTIVNIDNRSNNTKYGDVVHVDSKFTSLSEEVADFLTLLEPQIELDKDTSQNLLSGILSATNDFQNGSGSYLAFEMAGILMKKGAVRSANGGYANPTTPAMPAANYFPPQPAAQPAQVFQPQPSTPVVAPSFGNMFPSAPAAQPAPVQQPVVEPQPAPVAPVQTAQPIQSTSNDQPPADWLMPKVYKGSTVL